MCTEISSRGQKSMSNKSLSSSHSNYHSSVSPSLSLTPSHSRSTMPHSLRPPSCSPFSLSLSLLFPILSLSLSSLSLLHASRVSSHSFLEESYPDPSLSPSVVFDSSLTRELPLGKVMGSPCFKYGDFMHFLGIPYALPPVGNLRFRAPQPYNISYGYPAFFATSLPRLCSYICTDGTLVPIIDVDKASEDCLYLNVWAPKTLPSKLLPVRMYIHGGHDKCGSTDPHSEGCAAVAKTNSIQVTLEFRRGPMGHLAHPATWGESGTTGNWALMDQQLVLRWVQENIAAFGGDPNQVLLFGNSAGAQAVEMHVVSPQSQGLFHSVISESPPCVSPSTLAQAYRFTDVFSPLVGCNGTDSATAELECLRSVPWATLYDLTTTLSSAYFKNLLACTFRDRYLIWDYTIDGVVIPYEPEDALRQGKYSKVPYMVGSTVDEGMSAIDLVFDVDNISMETIKYSLEDLYPGLDYDYILDVYPESLYANDPKPHLTRLSQMITDISFNCPIYFRMKARMEASDTTSWQYRWGATPSCPVEWTYLRAHHACEVYFVFGLVPVGEFTTGLCNFTEAEVQLSYTVLTAWTTMSLDGIPKWENGTAWPTWDAVNQREVFLDSSITAIVDTKNMEERCSRHRAALGGVIPAEMDESEKDDS